jgi:probable DNA repair protein
MQDLNKLLQELDSTHVILTPNQRLAAYLQQQYHAYQIQLGKTTWEKVQIWPLQTWVQLTWQTCVNAGIDAQALLLNDAQELFLWESILQQSKQASQLLRLAETAQLARSAWGLLQQWQITLDHPGLAESEDGRTLVVWLQTYASICKEKNILDRYLLIEQLIEKIQHSEIELPKKIIAFEFTEKPPQWQSLLDQCRLFGSEVIEWHHQENAHTCVYTQANTVDEEIILAARWAKQIIETEPKLRIACVFPNLEQIRDRVYQLFSTIFAPQHAYACAGDAQAFNISAGKSLAEYPVIHCALQLLQSYNADVSMETIGFLLQSPFIADAEAEYFSRAQLDKNLRRLNIKKIEWQLLLGLKVFSPCQKFKKNIMQFLQYVKQHSQSQLSHYEWARMFNHALTLIGWPGERSLNSEEYQTVQQWQKILQALSSLDQVSAKTTLAKSLQTLQRLVHKKIFQVQTPVTNIQILGLLETAGMPFDYVWLSGMNDMRWPPQPNPHPLIAKRLQRNYDFPHATAARELKFCQSLLQQFQQTCKHIVFSYARETEAGEVQLSPLLQSFPYVAAQALIAENYASVATQIFAHRALETLEDETAPPLREDEKIVGGINILKNQAECPFRAFAHWRLHAQMLETPTPGLRARDRGTLMHKILELFWQVIRDHNTLQSLSEQQLKDHLTLCIDKAMQKLVAPYHKNNYLTLEKQRLLKNVLGWIAVEKAREPFHVYCHEQSYQLTLNRLSLNIRIDRIDLLSDQRYLIIDYKASKYQDIKQLFGDRPDEPQLALYAILHKDKVAAVSFAQITPGAYAFKGLSHAPLNIPGIKCLAEVNHEIQDWYQLLQHWQSVFLQLSAEFSAGYARVDPKEQEKTCQWCDLQSFCRIYESESAPC